MFKHILVPVDGSELSQQAVEKAIELAKEVSAQITLLYAEPENLAPYMGIGAISDSHVTQTVKEHLDSAANEFLNNAEVLAKQAGVRYQRCLGVTNHPWQLIIKTADEADCDLILMASHGRSGVSSLLLGSETQKVLAHSTLPVLVYR